MAAGVYDFSIEQGAHFARTFTWKDAEGDPIPLTGYTAALQLRVVPHGTLVADWTEYVSITEASGVITLFVPAGVTAILGHPSGVYDLEITPPEGPDYTRRFLQGAWQRSPEVTRDE